MIKILIVEDNHNLRKMIDIYLKQNNFETYLASNGLEALDILGSNVVNLVICDIMMPKMDGFELIKDIRSVYADLPIIIVTAKEAKEDKLAGFRLGTDDYMTKPIDLEELLMRIHALLRRYDIKNEHKLNIGKVELDYDNISIKKGEDIMYLPKKEFYLLYKLLSYPGRIFTRIEIMDDIWGMDTCSDEQTVNVHIRRLREKFKDFEEFEIVTVRGLGYKAERKV